MNSYVITVFSYINSGLKITFSPGYKCCIVSTWERSSNVGTDVNYKIIMDLSIWSSRFN